MPLYEYRCNTCGEAFEKMVRWSEADRAPSCPHCQSLDTQKKMSTFASPSAGNSSSYSSGCGTGGGRFS